MRSNTNYNIIIWLGINDLNYRTADVYFDEYYKLAKEEWDSYNVYIVKVGPVRDDLEVVTNDLSLPKIDSKLASLKEVWGYDTAGILDKKQDKKM